MPVQTAVAGHLDWLPVRARIEARAIRMRQCRGGHIGRAVVRVGRRRRTRCRPTAGGIGKIANAQPNVVVQTGRTVALVPIAVGAHVERGAVGVVGRLVAFGAQDVADGGGRCADGERQQNGQREECKTAAAVFAERCAHVDRLRMIWPGDLVVSLYTELF